MTLPEIVLAPGPSTIELLRYANEHTIDLAIVQAAPGGAGADAARALLDHGRCAVLILRR